MDLSGTFPAWKNTLRVAMSVPTGTCSTLAKRPIGPSRISAEPMNGTPFKVAQHLKGADARIDMGRSLSAPWAVS